MEQNVTKKNTATQFPIQMLSANKGNKNSFIHSSLLNFVFMPKNEIVEFPVITKQQIAIRCFSVSVMLDTVITLHPSIIASNTCFHRVV